MIPSITIRDITDSDLPIFFDQQLAPEATAMAAVPSRDMENFNVHWVKIMADGSIILRTILYNGQVAGHLISCLLEDEREVGYWLGREFWGKWIATKALVEFLKIVNTRPLFGRVAKHNISSRRVLEKCGFSLIGEDKYMNRGNEEVEEFVLKLESQLVTSHKAK